MGSLQTVAGSTERLACLLNERPAVRPMPWTVALPHPAIGRLDFDSVSFSYDAADRPAVANLGFSVATGDTVALVGASGAGKSTVFALIQRFYDITAGSIRIDGIDIRQADPAELRSRIASVEQDPTIFAGTIADNIRFGRAGATDLDVGAAARSALVTEFSDGLPAGLDTLVGERGVRLSGGQRQRIAIARAILKDAPILLLDEATSALDSFNEKLVQDALARLRAGRTTLVIAHRLSTIRHADEILVLDQGHIVDRGTHSELVARSGIYEELVRLQFPVAASPAMLH
jgi:ATP-binding cassette subfamily B protein